MSCFGFGNKEKKPIKYVKEKKRLEGTRGDEEEEEERRRRREGRGGEEEEERREEEKRRVGRRDSLCYVVMRHSK